MDPSIADFYGHSRLGGRAGPIPELNVVNEKVQVSTWLCSTGFSLNILSSVSLIISASSMMMGTMEERAGVVYVTAEEMRRMDDATIREFHVDVLMLMENAGRATATLAKQMLREITFGKRVACLVGGGNNGGDGMVAARHLSNWGANVNVIVSATKDRIKDVPLRQLHILEKMGIPILSGDYDLRDYNLLIDGLIGYGLEGNPRDGIAVLIKDANSSQRPILALDVPSGMNATTVEVYDPCIKATATLTLALPKVGFLAPSASLHVGELYLADISIPRKLYRTFGQQKILFQDDALLKL